MVGAKAEGVKAVAATVVAAMVAATMSGAMVGGAMLVEGEGAKAVAFFKLILLSSNHLCRLRLEAVYRPFV